jgi:ElaB/YqjD/DUF883 family membrane-anchored ribosome-binding protein
MKVPDGAGERLAARSAPGNDADGTGAGACGCSGKETERSFGMADENTPNAIQAEPLKNAPTSNEPGPGASGGGDVTFDADPKLEADAAGAGAAIDFEADGAGEPKRTTAQTLKDEAGKLGTQAAERARAFAGEGKDRATGALDEVANMFRGAADEVDAKLGAEYGRYARSAADGIAGFAESLRGKEVDELLDTASDFVRKSPAVAVGTAAAVGFVLARLIKSGIDAASDLGETAATSTPARETTDA